MAELIDVAGMTIQFLRDKHETKGSLDMFEMTCPADGAVPEPHYHRDWDETAYMLEGSMTFTVDGKPVELGPGQTLFIPRGVVHGFDNKSGETVRMLSVLTPGVLGPEYFRELGAYLAKGKPDPSKIRDILLKHGLVPA